MSAPAPTEQIVPQVPQTVVRYKTPNWAIALIVILAITTAVGLAGWGAVSLRDGCFRSYITQANTITSSGEGTLTMAADQLRNDASFINCYRGTGFSY